MSIMELGALGEFFGAIAVVVTLIYLAVQLKQNTAQLRMDSFQRHLDNHGAPLQAVCLNAEVVKVFVPGLSDYEGLSAEDRMIFHGAVSGFFYAYVANLRLHEEGILSYEDFEMGWEIESIVPWIERMRE